MAIMVGIDAGISTGFAVSLDKKLIEVTTLTFWETVEKIKMLHDNFKNDHKITVVIEDVTQNKPTFNRGVNAQANTRISQNVGSNKRDCQLMIEYCENLGLSVLRVRPTKASMTKLKAEEFKRITGWQGSTSSHSRDAGILLLGR